MKALKMRESWPYWESKSGCVTKMWIEGQIGDVGSGLFIAWTHSLGNQRVMKGIYLKPMCLLLEDCKEILYCATRVRFPNSEKARLSHEGIEKEG